MFSYLWFYVIFLKIFFLIVDGHNNFIYLFVCGLRIKTSASNVLGKGSTTEL